MICLLSRKTSRFQPGWAYIRFQQHTAIFTMCQATFTMKFAKSCVIMVYINKKAFQHDDEIGYLYNVHKKALWFL